jgi:hypothetical protein
VNSPPKNFIEEVTMAKFKSEYVVNRKVPFVYGEIVGDADGVFEVTDAEFANFLESSTDFQRLDAPKPQPKASNKEAISKPEATADEQ